MPVSQPATASKGALYIKHYPDKKMIRLGVKNINQLIATIF